MKNKGFSLIELIVVLAIMAVATAVGGYSLSAITLANAKNCATEMNAALEETRNQSYSTDSATATATVSFYYGDDGVYLEKNFEGSAKKIASSKMKITYTLKGDTTEYQLGDETEKIIFSFDRSSGAFRNVVVGSDTKGACTSLVVESGAKSYTITCYPSTGKTKVE